MYIIYIMNSIKHLKYKGGWQTPEKLESLSKSVPIRSLNNFKKTKRKKRKNKSKRKQKRRRQTKRKQKRRKRQTRNRRNRRKRYKKK